MTETPDYMTAVEAAEIIRMEPDYVRRQCKAGNIRAKKLGTEWRITRAALDDFMAGGPAPATRTRLTARQQRRSA